MKVNVAQLCASTSYTGSTLAVLLLLATWPRADHPCKDEVASLTRISPRQAERILEKLESDGLLEASHRRGQGQKNTYQFNTSWVTDKSNMTRASNKAVNTTPMTDKEGVNTSQMSEKEPKSDTGDALTDELNTTPVSVPSALPYKDSSSDSTDSHSTSETPTPRGASSPRKSRQETALSKLEPEEQEIIRAWSDLAKAYPPEAAWPTILERLREGFDRGRFKKCGGAYLAYYGKGQRYVGGILDWYDENLTAPRAHEKNGNGSTRQNSTKESKPSVTDRAREYDYYYGTGTAKGTR